MYYSNIRLYRDLHACAKRMYGHERFLEVRYEDFVRDPDATQRLIQDKFPWLENRQGRGVPECGFRDRWDGVFGSGNCKVAAHWDRPRIS